MTDEYKDLDDAMSVEVDAAGKASVTFAEPQIIDEPSPLKEEEQDVEETPLLHSMMEVMALSYLVFMYADLRALSSTGRISTRFEHIAVESDYSPRFEADFIAGDQAASKKKKKDGGLSTSQIMAVMLLEIQSYTSRAAKLKEGHDANNSNRDSVGSNLGSNPDTHDHKLDKKNMTKLLQIYASIIGADMKKNVGNVEVRKSVRDLASSQTAPVPPQASRRFHFSAAVERIMQMKNNGGEKDSDPANNNDENDGAVEDAKEEEGGVLPPVSPTSSVPPASKFTRSALMSKVKGQKAAIRLPQVNQNEDDDMEMITNNIFSSAAAGLVGSDSNNSGGKTGGGNLVAVSGEDMRRIMYRAVTSRIYSKLDFMANFFREGTVSHLMALSNVRVVWFNDWYPAKELTYGICVDETKNRVIIVFRGAITTKDWSKAAEFNFAKAKNPVEGDGHPTVKLHNGFYSYLFRKRKDTGTTKYHQIAEVAHRIGTENFGQDYNLVVCGHSLGAALSTVFSFWASTDPRFTRNGPIQVFTFGSPYVGSNDFADEWRRQEEAGKLRYARFYNHNDLITYGPSSNLVPTSRGSSYRHVGIGVAIHPVPRHLKWARRGYEPGLSYIPDESPGKAYCRGLKNTWALHLGIPWKIQKRHTLQELIKRVADGKREGERLGRRDEKGHGFDLMNNSLNVLYGIKADL